MSWAISGRELENLPDTVKRDILKEQIEKYHRTQEAAQRILRTALAAVALIVAFAGTDIFSSLLSLQIPTGDVTAAGGNVTLHDMLTQSSVNTHFVGMLFLITTAGIGLFTILNTIRTLRIQGPRPLYPLNSVKLTTTTQSRPTAQLDKWLKQNDRILENLESRKEWTYASLSHAITMFILGTLLIGAAYSGILQFMGLINGFVLILGPAYAVYYLRELPGVLIRNALSDGLKSGLIATFEKYGEISYMKGPNPTYQVIYVIFFGVYYPYSLAVFQFWLFTELI